MFNTQIKQYRPLHAIKNYTPITNSFDVEQDAIDWINTELNKFSNSNRNLYIGTIENNGNIIIYH